MPNVFISYSHDSEQHRQQVLDLADRLNRDSINCELDQYVNGSPEQGWPMWMEQQLEEAEFVLLVCTETYFNRVQRKEPRGIGKGVKWESLLTYQELYDNDSGNRKFIPVVFSADQVAFIPRPLKPFSHYDLSQADSYELLCRYLTDQPQAVKPSAEQALHLPPRNAVSHQANLIYSNRLPATLGEFFGRKQELKLLDDALADNNTRIVQFIAPGGTGKTKLLQYWLDRQADMPVLIVWSFYSQGSSEDKQVSATPFFEHAFDKLKAEKRTFRCEEDKGEYLAELINKQSALLVLDGLEPLQHGGFGMKGELKDRAMRALLKTLAGGHRHGLCVITTRLAVADIQARSGVISHDLHNLEPDDGVALLKSLKVKGRQSQLEQAVEDYGRHALALSLLGNALATFHNGDVQKRDLLSDLVDEQGDPGSRHAFKVMQAYNDWLSGTTELQVLHVLGLFDHPVGMDVIKLLWEAKIPGLTAVAEEQDDANASTFKTWQSAIKALRDGHRLLLVKQPGSDLLDCHPLLREYFGRSLKKQPQVWQQAHRCLYEYYKALPEKQLPDNLSEMQPLFAAVSHGCAAGLQQQALVEVYWPRIKRDNEHY